jgi:hypothetical protein
MTERGAVTESTGSAAPAVLREILRTPAFRELIRIQLGGVDGATGRELVRTLIEEEVALPLDLVGCSPAALDAAIAGALEVGQRLAGLPEPLLRAYVEDILADLDADAARELPRVWGPLLVRTLPFATAALAEAVEGLARSVDEPGRRAEVVAEILAGLDAGRIGGAINALSELAIHVHADVPDAVVESDAISRLLDAVDTGKLRKAVGAASAMGRDVTLAAVDHGLSDPVVLANTVVALAPLVNDGLAVVAGVLERLNLPDELLASSVLGLIDDLDGETLGRIATGAAAAIHGIHAGSLTLGATEPAFRAIVADLLDQALRTVDGPTVARAVIALGEDGETLSAVLADWIRRDPAVLRAWAETVALTGAPLVRGATAVVREVNALGDEPLADATQAFADATEPREVARLINELAALALRLQEQRPDAANLREMVAALDLRRLGAVASALGEQLADAGAEHPHVREALAPRALGDRINGQLRRFNRYMERGFEDNTLLQVVDAVDPAELEQAWRHVLGLLTGTAVSSAELVRAVFRPAVDVGLESARVVLGPSLSARAQRRVRRRRFPWIGSTR